MSKLPAEVAAAAFERSLLLTSGQLSFGFFISKFGRMLFFALTAVSVLLVILIFFFIIIEAWPFVAEHGVSELFTSAAWYPEAQPAEFGGLSLIMGSLYVTAGATLIAGPVGLILAAFLSDVVPFGARQIIKPVVELLAAIPSVAYGFFAIMVFAPFLQKHFNLPSGTNIINAACLLAVMALPTIVSVAEDAMTALGPDLRAASYALGATRAQTVFRTVFPFAHNGVIAAIILGIMRAIGETMVVWMAAGNAAQIPSPWWNLSLPVRTMTATIAGDMGETVKGSDHYRVLFVVGLILLVFTFTLNLAIESLLRRRKRLAGGMKL